MLHIINKIISPNEDHIIKHIVADDQIIFIGDGVLNLAHAQTIKKLTPEARIFVLAEALNLKGLRVKSSTITTIDYDGFVDLVAHSNNHCSW